MSAPLRPRPIRAISAWVSANAGAGKTHLLTDRVTRLLFAGRQASRILCLTYTKAAAAEMATRLFERLGEWALLPDDELTARPAEIGAECLTRMRRPQARAPAVRTGAGNAGRTEDPDHPFLLPAFVGALSGGGRHPCAFHRARRTQHPAELMARGAQRRSGARGAGDAALAKRHRVAWHTRAADVRFAEILDFAIGDGAANCDAVCAIMATKRSLLRHLRKPLDVAEGEDEGADHLAAFCDDVGGRTSAVAARRALARCRIGRRPEAGRTDRTAFLRLRHERRAAMHLLRPSVLHGRADAARNVS